MLAHEVVADLERPINATRMGDMMAMNEGE